MIAECWGLDEVSVDEFPSVEDEDQMALYKGDVEIADDHREAAVEKNQHLIKESTPSKVLKPSKLPTPSARA